MSTIRSYLIATSAEVPQIGLMLADFDVNVYSVRKSDANMTHLVTDANMEFEVGDGIYGYHYSTSVDYAFYDYLVIVEYGGATDLDANTWNNFDADDDMRGTDIEDIIAGITDGSYDLQEMMRIIFSAIALKTAGGGTTTLTSRDLADSKDRITLTVDSNGNRTAVVLDGS